MIIADRATGLLGASALLSLLHSIYMLARSRALKQRQEDSDGITASSSNSNNSDNIDDNRHKYNSSGNNGDAQSADDSSLSVVDIMKLMTLISYAGMLLTWCFHFKAFGGSPFSVFVFIIALNWTLVRIPVALALLLGQEFIFVHGIPSVAFSIFCYFVEGVAVAYCVWERALDAYSAFQYDIFSFYVVMLKMCVGSNICLVFWFKVIVKQWNKSYLLVTNKNLIDSYEFVEGLRGFKEFSLQVWFGWFSGILRLESVQEADLYRLPVFLKSSYSVKEMVLCSKTYTSVLEYKCNNKIMNGATDDEDDEETIFFNSTNPSYRTRYFDQEIDLDAIRRDSQQYSKLSYAAVKADATQVRNGASSSSSSSSPSPTSSIFSWKDVTWLRRGGSAASLFRSSSGSKGTSSYSLYPLISLGLSVHASSLFSLGIIKMFTLLLSFAGPLLLGELVYFLQMCQDSSKSKETLLSEGFFLVALLVLSQLAMASLNALYSFRCSLMNMKLKGALLLLTFGKSISIPTYGNAELAEVSGANIMNIAQVDIDRVSGIFQSINDLWAVPLQIVIAFALLYTQVRIAFLAGVAVILVMLPLNSFVANKIGHFTKLLMQHKDARIKLLTEAFNSMKSVKMLGLESVVKNLSGAHRSLEVTYLGYRKYLDAVCVLLWASMPVLVPYITFMVTTGLGEEVTASNVFTTIALINMLIFPMNALPWIVNGFMENLVSLRRLGNLLVNSDGSKVSITDIGIFDEPLPFLRPSTTGPPPFPLSPPIPTSDKNTNASPVLSKPGPDNAVVSPTSNPLFGSKRRTSLKPSTLNQTSMPTDASSSSSSTDDFGFGIASSDFFDMPFTLTCAKWVAPPRSSPNPNPNSKEAGAGGSEQPVDPNLNLNPSREESFELASDTTSNISDAFERDRSGSQKSKWKLLVEPKADGFVIGPIDLECRSGSLTAVVGPVACGKSAFLLSILGEFRAIRESTSMITDISLSQQSIDAIRSPLNPSTFDGSGGSPSRQASRSFSSSPGVAGPMLFPKYATIDYCSQIPALHSEYSIKDNIVFGGIFNEERYNFVIRGCCLDKDFEQGVAGRGGITGETILSQNAQNLSGGQRLRVGVARALYSKSKVILLDDPFSALDRTTSLNLMQFLLYIAEAEGRTIILTTHSLFLISKVDQIVVLKNGEVSMQGPSSEVAAKDPFLVDGMKVFAQEGSEPSYSSSPTSSPSIVISASSSDISSQNDKKTVEVIEDNGAEILLRGKISSSVIWYYIRAVGYSFSAGTVVSILLMQLSSNALFYWLAYWVSHQDRFSRTEFVGITSLIVLCNFTFGILRSFLFAEGGLKGAKNIYNALVSSLLSVNIEFYERFNTGKIVNRVGKDTNTIDDQLPFMVNIVLAQSFQILGSCLIIGITDPLVIAVLLLVFFLYYRLQVFYRRSSRQLRRLESNSRSPVYAIIGDCSANGISIRAMSRLAHFSRLLQGKIDAMQAVTLNVSIAQQWLSIRLQFLGVMITTTLALSAILCSIFHVLSVSPALLGLSISYSLTIVNNLNGLVGSTSETEQEMISVERVYEYSFMRNGMTPRSNNSQSRSEANGDVERGDDMKSPLLGDENIGAGGDYNPYNEPFTQDDDDALKKMSGIRSSDMGRLDYAIDIVAEDLSFCYAQTTHPALNKVSFTIQSGKRVAVVGRTGSGKSTLIRCLLGLSCNHYTGSLKISGLEMRDFSADQLDSLRQAISCVPQDPLIFTGSLRFNLDPKGAYSEQELLQVISRTKLPSALTHNRFGDIGASTSSFMDNVPLLDFPISAAGSSLSIGQKQLICVARILLKRSRLIIIDEATSSVDSVAEKHIYETLCRHAKETNATVLCVCHKLESVKDLCEISLELDRGSLVRLSKI